MTTNSNDRLASIAVQDARAAVAESGQLVALDGPYYLAAGAAPDAWLPYFISNETIDGVPAHPVLAKMIVERVGQKPREVFISWDEYFQRDDDDAERRLKWLEQPMTMFGAAIERHALRVVFGDVLADLLARAADARAALGMPAAVTTVIVNGATSEPERDWLAEIEAAADGLALDALYEEARAAGALAQRADLQSAFGVRLRDLMAKKTAPVTPKPAPQAGGAPRPQGGGRRRGGRGRSSQPKAAAA